MVTFPLCREPDARFGVRGPCAVAPQRRGPVPASALHLQADRGRQAGVRYRVKDVHLRTLSGAGCRSEAGRGAAEPSRGCRRGEGANRDDVVKSKNFHTVSGSALSDAARRNVGITTKQIQSQKSIFLIFCQKISGSGSLAQCRLEFRASA
jgi:hypothetical protein